MDEKIPKRFLPIGTVVLLKNGQKEVMITSYCIFPNNTQIKNSKEVKPEMKLYEYSGCIFPEGIIDSNVTCAFNHEDIQKISYIGYQSKEQQKLSETLDKEYDNIKKQFLEATK